MTTPYPPEDHVPEPPEQPDLFSMPPTGPQEARVDLTLKGLSPPRARALLAVLGRLEDGPSWVPPADEDEAEMVVQTAIPLHFLECVYRHGKEAVADYPSFDGPERPRAGTTDCRRGEGW